MNTTRAPSPPRAAVPATATPTMPIASTTSTPPPMSSRPASARPKNSSSSIASSSASSHMPSASSNGKPRGTTPSASRSSLKAALGEPDRPTRAASKDSLKQKMAKKPDDSHKQPSKSEEQLKALKSDFDGLRSHLTCKICDRLLYQPYTIACGHTYCYSCLCTWFVNNKTRKTCPDCRTAVTHPPAPAYIIRDMTSMFIARAELLPAGETVEQHKVWSQEEADVVQQDKDNTDRRNGGLFKACFRSQLPLGPPLHAIRDQDDGVDRCPVCSWELEDSECIQCGLLFDENGELTWTDSFNGFSDMDEMSEQDMESEDLDADMDMEDQDFDGLGPEGWGDYYPDEVNFTMQRFLGHGIPPQAAFARRRPLSHSEAGSRRLYSPSIISDMYTDDMDTVQEEEEEGMDEDSSMNDFIEDDEHEPESGTSQSGSSTLSRTPQPSSARPGFQARNRRVVESESSSTISSVAEEEEEDDEEDQGPIRRGQRNRAQTRILNRANGSQESSGPPSSTSTDASMDELDEETQALLQAEGWFQHNEMDEQGEDDEDDGSDGGRTTVGWDATAISNDRIRMGGSLTPTADRPRPNTTIRPPSRAGSPLRQRPSLLPSAHLNYEDGEADDDDSDPDHDGDINMAMRALRSRRSRAQIRNAATFRASDYRLPNRGNSQGAEQDDHSDTSESGDHRRPRQEYNPRISRLFADHQRALMELQRGGPLLDLEPRSITPITRPRTSNRNRPSPAQAYSPFMAPAPARLRTPNMNHSSNTAANLRSPASPPRRNAPPSSLLETIADANTSAQNHSAASSVSSGPVVPTPSTSSASSRASTVAPDAAPNAPVEAGDRPPSRVSARPPSATGRRTPGFSPVYANFPHTNVGLNIQGRIFPHQVMGNPWGAFVQPRNVRTRSSRQVLREQSSTATLRAPNSRINLREGLTSPQGVRPQPSRVELRSQPSRRRLNPQNSTRTLRASEHNRPPQSPVVPSPTTSSAPRPSRLTQEETSARARELVNNRLQALGQSNAAPSRNNPFVQGFRRPTTASASPANPAPAAGSQHMRSSSNESNQSGSSHATAPPSPGLARRRSSRHMAATASGALSQPLGAYQAPAGAYNNNYFRSRQNSIGSIGSSAFDVPLDGNARGISPMMATSLI